jgi:hypothetical protein
MITSVIFSKNRACQLDLLLRSIKKYWDNYQKERFKVIYHYDKKFKKGYDILIKRFPWVEFKERTEFKQDLISCLDDNEYFTMFTDDDFFKEVFITHSDKMDMLFLDASILCLSLRMGKNITGHYIKGKSKQPEFDEENRWFWRGQEIDWAYPMSVGGGHIFRTSDISPCIRNYDYNEVWNLETGLMKQPINRPKMVCYDTSKVFDNPCNSVSTEIINKCGNITAKELNDNYLAGKQIDLNKYHNFKNTMVHQIMEVSYENVNHR